MRKIQKRDNIIIISKQSGPNNTGKNQTKQEDKQIIVNPLLALTGHLSLKNSELTVRTLL